MAVIHRAQLRPTKLEALARWLPRQPWSGAGEGAELLQAGRFRFDDPAGEVGIETLLVHAGGEPVLQVPLTYRGAPLAGAEEFLVTTMEHSVLGPRWVYDAVGDPVFADVLRRTVLTGGCEADLQLAVDGRLEPAPEEVTARGSGTAPDAPAVTATWGDRSAVLAVVPA